MPAATGNTAVARIILFKADCAERTKEFESAARRAGTRPSAQYRSGPTYDEESTLLLCENQRPRPSWGAFVTRTLRTPAFGETDNEKMHVSGGCARWETPYFSAAF